MKNKNFANRIKELRVRKGLSQEELSEKTGLSLRTIQRIENGETEPRGDSLKRLTASLGVSPDEIIDWHLVEDNNVLCILNLSQIGFIIFPFLGIIIPMAIWILKKDKIIDVDKTGKSILNFQITWTAILFLTFLFFLIYAIFPIDFIAQISAYEQKKVIDNDMIEKFAKALNVAPGFIRELEEDPVTVII